MIRHSSFCCKKCGIKRRTINTTIKKEDILRELKYFEFTPIHDISNITTKDKILVRDKNEYLGYVVYERLKRNNNMLFEVFNISCNKDNYIHNINLYCKLNYIDAIAIDFSEEYWGGSQGIKFKCSCGNEFHTSLNLFRTGVNRCKKCANSKSKYQLMTEQFLKENSVEFRKEFRFDDCRNIFTLPFDLYIQSKNILIEVDGQFHYEPVFGEDNLKKTQTNDEIKNKYCKENNIKLIRIPYWEFDKNNYKNILFDNIINA